MKVETSIPMDKWHDAGPAAVVAESSGFDGVLSFEIANDPFIPLAFAAVATKRIQLGTSIAVCFPRSPMIMATSAWDLHLQSKGRFTLGLGTQVKGHNVRRFSVPWSPPQPRLREYVESLRAIWRCWETGEKLDYEGEHYAFSLMTPEFSPPKSGLRPIPVTIAAVGPALLRLAGEICDGVRLHVFATRKYVEEMALPEIRSGLNRAGRDRSNFEVWGGGFIVTGKDEAALAQEREEVRYRIAFYGSTRSYHPILALHGWEDLGLKLHEMSKKGQWKQMAAQVPDEVLEEFAVIATYDDLVSKLTERFGGQTDCITLPMPEGIPDDQALELIQDIRRINSPFKSFPTSW